MAKVYVTKCSVRKNKKQYQKGIVIEGLTAEEIERGLAQHWLEEVGSDQGPTDVGDRKNKKGGKDKEVPVKSERDHLLEKAVDLGILDQITDEMTVEEIQQLITAAGNSTNTENGGGKTLDEMSKKELKAEADKLGVKYGMMDSEDEIRQKIKVAQGAGV
jgi:hypothetical protein